MYEHVLIGCQSRPLSGYLKALAVMRLVAEQKDPSITGFWKGSVFTIRTVLDREELMAFFCSEYVPTPIVTPWNGGSGFIRGHDENKPSDEGIRMIRSSDIVRLKEYREVIEMIKSWPEWLGDDASAEDAESFKKKVSDAKAFYISLCRSRLPDTVVQWIDAIGSINQSHEKFFFNKLLGTGGNDGNLDFGSGFMNAIASLFVGKFVRSSLDFISASLFGTLSKSYPQSKIGQFDPGKAGGYNQGMGIEHKDFKANPWDYVLSLEGTLLFSGSVSRRNEASPVSFVSSPFTVSATPVGYASSEESDHSRQETELWLPLWPNKTSYGELRYVFSEGRSNIGRKPAVTGIEFSRAAGSLGTDRGFSAFERYSFIVRRGKSLVALPAGTIPVKYDPALEPLGELDSILRQIDRFIKTYKAPPSSLRVARRRIDEALYACTLQPDGTHYTDLVRALGCMEYVIAKRDLQREINMARPLYGISAKWPFLCDDGKTEVRIAAALSSIHRTGGVGPLRSTMAGVSAAKPWQWEKEQPQTHWFGSNLVERLGNVAIHRIMDAEREAVQTFPFMGYLKLQVHDIMPFLMGETDDLVIEELLWGFSLIDWNKDRNMLSECWNVPVTKNLLSRSWLLHKMLFSSENFKDSNFKREMNIAALLKAGRVGEANEKALLKLRLAGLSPYPIEFRESLDNGRLLASLMVPARGLDACKHYVLELPTEKGATNA